MQYSLQLIGLGASFLRFLGFFGFVRVTDPYGFAGLISNLGGKGGKENGDRSLSFLPPPLSFRSFSVLTPVSEVSLSDEGARHHCWESSITRAHF